MLPITTICAGWDVNERCAHSWSSTPALVPVCLPPLDVGQAARGSKRMRSTGMRSLSGQDTAAAGTARIGVPRGRNAPTRGARGNARSETGDLAEDGREHVTIALGRDNFTFVPPPPRSWKISIPMVSFHAGHGGWRGLFVVRYGMFVHQLPQQDCHWTRWWAAGCSRQRGGTWILVLQEVTDRCPLVQGGRGRSADDERRRRIGRRAIV